MKRIYKSAIIEIPERCPNCAACSWKTEHGVCCCASCGKERETITSRGRANEKTTLSSVKKEMAEPRVAKSARQQVANYPGA
jgi:hypothetical protein